MLRRRSVRISPRANPFTKQTVLIFTRSERWRSCSSASLRRCCRPGLVESQRRQKLGEPTPAFFFLSSGLLSSALDNAPTYLSFLSVLMGATHDSDIHHLIATNGISLVAISIRAVFFGACTYIGNGPNFMVKSIADQQKIHTPTFLGYIFKFTLPVHAADARHHLVGFLPLTVR